MIRGTEEFGRIEQGDVLVTNSTTTAFNIVLPLLGAIVTDRGGLLSHAAIVAREYRIAGGRRLHGCHLGTSRRGESDRRRDGGAGRGRRMTEAAAPIEHVRRRCAAAHHSRAGGCLSGAHVRPPPPSIRRASSA